MFSIFSLVFFVLKSLLGIVRQWSLEKFAILTLQPRSHVRILIYRTWTVRGKGERVRFNKRYRPVHQK